MNSSAIDVPVNGALVGNLHRGRAMRRTGRTRTGWVALSGLGIAACVPAATTQQYEIPEFQDPCAEVSLADGKVDGVPEFRALFSCLNNMGALVELEPMIDELSETENPDTGNVYLEDLIAITNAALADPDFAEVVEASAVVVDQGVVDDVLPVAGTFIDSGVAAKMLPVVQASIDSGAAAQALPPIEALLRDPRMPSLLTGTKQFLDEGLAQGWMDAFVPDLATVLTVKKPDGTPAVRDVVPPLTGFLAAGNAGGFVPVVDQLLDTGTVDQLLAVTRELYDQGVLQNLDEQLRPLMLQDAQGHSDLQGTLEILAGTDGPLTCFGLTLTDNLAKMILETMADRTPSDIENLVGILKGTLGLADLFCTIPPEVAAHLDSLDALAKSGALDGLLPMLRVFKSQGQVGILVELLVAVHECGSLPPLEPVLVVAIEAGVMDRLLDTLPHAIAADGTPTQAARGVLDLVDILVSPAVPGDPETAPALSILPLVGAAAESGANTFADMLYLMGETLQDPDSGFDAILPALSAALGADPEGDLLLVAADMIETGCVERSLPMMSWVIEQGHAEAMLPWASKAIHDGTADALLQMLARTFDLMETGG